MKNHKTTDARKLHIHRETLRQLNDRQLEEVAGGRIKLTGVRTSCDCDPSLPVTVCASLHC